MKGKILITFFVALFLLTIIPYDVVTSTSVTEIENFENGVVGTQLTYAQSTSGDMMTKRYSGLFNVSSSYKRSGSKGFNCGMTYPTGSSSGWFNYSYSKSSYLTNYSFYSHCYGSMQSYMYFYNDTNQGHNISVSNVSWSKCIVALWFDGTGDHLYYYDDLGVNNIISWSEGSIKHIYFKVEDATGLFEYGFESVNLHSKSCCNPSAISNNWRIDRVIIKSNTVVYGISFDDLNFTTSTSYTVGGGGSGGCISTTGLDYYSKNIEVMDGYIDIATPYIEFTSHSTLSITPEVFELWVGSALYEGDSDTSNYFLYINGLSAGNPVCFYLLSGETYVMQWDLSTFSPISEEVLIFEVAHTITFDGTYYWNIAKVTASSPPSPTQITYRNTGTNGVLDGSLYYYGSCWKLFYSAFGTPEEEENNDFDVGINLIGFNTHSIYATQYCYIYDTIYFEVFSNRTDTYYHINISKGSSTIGNEQGFPKDIYSYHIIHGFTPSSQGNYTVSLCRDSNNEIVDHEHFNVTSKTVDYAIWTFPNPSNTGTNHGVGVYISDDSTFLNFYISGVVDSDNVNNYTLSDRKIKVGTLDINKYWSTSLVTFAIGGWEYWRMWGTNDNVSFIPLTSIYLHYVNTFTTNNYIRTSLTNGEGYVGESFNVYGLHGYILSQLQVYLDNKPIKDVSTNVSFLIPYSFSSVGTHTFSLRILNDGEWEVVDSVIVSIVIKPSGEDDFSGFLPAPYSYLMGAIVTIMFMILPSIALGKIGISGSETLKYVPIFSGTVGFIVSCLIGFFPWYSIFALLFVLILIIVVLYLSKNKQ
jgi:hypothetical protein